MDGHGKGVEGLKQNMLIIPYNQLKLSRAPGPSEFNVICYTKATFCKMIFILNGAN